MKTIEDFRLSVESLDIKTFDNYFSPFSYYNNSMEGASDVIYYRESDYYNEESLKNILKDIMTFLNENETEIMEILCDKLNDYEDFDYEDVIGFEYLNIIGFFFYGKLKSYDYYRCNVPSIF